MKLQEGRELVFAKKPEFAKLYKDYRDKSWIDYSRENYPGEILSLPLPAGRQGSRMTMLSFPRRPKVLFRGRESRITNPG